MSELRQQMIDAMRQRGYSVRTHEAYLGAVADLAKFYRRSPDRLCTEEVKAYLRHIAVERSLSGSTCRQRLHALRFFYDQVLEWEGFEFSVPLPKLAQRIPELLTRAEVARILGAPDNHKHRMLLVTCYGCGLRVGELVAIRVRRDIDGEHRLLRVEQGKGRKDRLVPIGATLLAKLREYWRGYRPPVWLFAHGNHPQQSLGISTCQKVFQRSKAKAGVEKIGGIHSLRHAYATHQLASGLPLQDLQHYLGHKSIRTTLAYLHWVPNYREAEHQHDLIAQLPEAGAVRHD